jgi:hypothetical protein
MTLDPKALDAARRAVGLADTWTVFDVEARAELVNWFATQAVSAYLAALGRDPLVEAAWRTVAVWERVGHNPHVGAQSALRQLESCIAALDAALGEGDDGVDRTCGFCGERDGHAEGCDWPAPPDDPDYCTQEQIDRANDLGRRGAKMVRRTRP